MVGVSIIKGALEFKALQAEEKEEGVSLGLH